MTVRSRRWVAPVLAAALVALACAVPAGAQTPTVSPGSSTAASPTLQTLPGGLVRPGRQDVAPPGRTRTPEQVLEIARRVPKVQEAVRERIPGRLTREAFLKEPSRWQVSYVVEHDGQRTEIAQVLVDDLSGAVLEAWTGYQVPWTMARGYPGAFGRGVNSPWVWLPLCVLFAVPFVDLRNPWRMLHLDLLVLTGFSVALGFFNAAKVGISTPLVVPLLVYLLARMLHVGLGRGDPRPRRPLPLMVPVSWLAIAAVFLVGFRIGLNLTDSNVIDVGYAGVIGADHITGGEPLYGGFPSENEHGDTYGPVTYLAYVPFELLLPWSGSWDDLPAAHAAALLFDLLVIATLYVLGRRIRGPRTGVVLAYTWIAFPFSLFVSNTNANDALPAVLVLAALLAIAHPAGRGALIALAGLTKFAPFALVPLFARARGSLARFALGFLAAGLVACIPIVLHGGTPRAFWDATLGYQADRGSPFAIYGLWGGLDWLRAIVGVAAAALAVAVAFVPRRHDLVGLAALSAAVLIAVQLWLSYWFFLYLAWIGPLVFIALLAREGEPAR